MPLDPALTLDLWERSVGRPGAQRDEALLGSAPRSLTERNALALHRYAAMFGHCVELIGRCPHCAAAVEFSIDVDACALQLPHDPDACEWHELDAGGERLRFRLPCPADVHALQELDDDQAFAEQLLARCVEGGQLPPPPSCDAISRRMEALAPGASLRFALQCPDCGKGWNAPLDPVDLLWRELRHRAEQLLGEVTLLARSWGWSERDILRLSPVRRAAYLQLATG